MKHKMADEEGKPTQPAIGQEDVKNIRNFFKHFNVPGSDQLEQSLKDFEANMTVDNEFKVKVELSKVMMSVKHPAFTDKMFEGIFKESENVAYHSHFDEQLAETLKEEEKKED